MNRENASSPSYAFRSMRPADLKLARRWLETPEVVRWWGDPAEEEDLLRLGFSEDGVQMWIVSHDKTPFAFVQDYVGTADMEPYFGRLAPGTRCIDMFIGEPAMLERGHGSRLLRQHALRLLKDGAPAAAIDPVSENRRAVRAYEKAGFCAAGEFPSSEGIITLMIFNTDCGLSL